MQSWNSIRCSRVKNRFDLFSFKMKLHRNPVSWILETVLGTPRTVFLTVFWTFLVLASIVTIQGQMSRDAKATTSGNNLINLFCLNFCLIKRWRQRFQSSLPIQNENASGLIKLRLIYLCHISICDRTMSCPPWGQDEQSWWTEIQVTVIAWLRDFIEHLKK